MTAARPVRPWLALLAGLAALLLALAVSPQGAAAQGAVAQGTGSDAAVLVADRISVAPDRSLTAEGRVEVLYRGARLTAQRIRYDQRGDRLTIDGPLTLADGDEVLILADQADLSGDMRDGILRAARLVLNRQLQIASTEVARVGGRFTRMGPSVASSCRICTPDQTPLWEIRAARIVHDQEAQRIFFDRAEFRFAGVPLAYLPRLDVPDPTVTRATGFLTPSVFGSSALGVGVQAPFFIALAQDRDLTVTPTVTARRAVAVQARYRQAFITGGAEITLGIARDQTASGPLRGWALGSGRLGLGPQATLDWQLELASDRLVLDHYRQGGREVLESRVGAIWLDRDRLARARLTQFHSLRLSDDNRLLPNTIADARLSQRFVPPALGGEATVTLDALVAYRRSDLDIAGRDVARASVRVDWRRDWTLAGGLRAGLVTQLQADHARIRQDSGFPDARIRTSGALAAELRWPLAGTDRRGGAILIEPAAQLVLAPRTASALPNEDSRLVEFDEANLFALNRFPGFDGTETGRRATVGVNWLRHDPDGWSMGGTVGRVIRFDTPAPGQFSTLSGLSGQRSDWLVALRLDSGQGLSLAGRALLDTGAGVTKGEVMLGWSGARLDVSTGYVQLIADPAENRPDPGREWALDAAWQLGGAWTALADWRYDMTGGGFSRAAIGARFRNECLAVDVSLSRRQPTSINVAASVDFGLQVDLIGFGGGAPGPARRCTPVVTGG